MIDEQSVLDICNDDYFNLPSVVIEKTHTEAGATKTDRLLISRNQLDELYGFWMIESRLVISLGSISRDLGRELSLNDFLTSLAPDLINPTINPIVLEAEKIDDSIKMSHIPVQVVFSRSQQQTRVKWEKGQSWSQFFQNQPNLDVILKSPEYIEKCLRHFEIPGVAIDQRRALFQQYLNNVRLFEVAKVSGDEEIVKMIKTKVCPIFHEDSASGMLISILRNRIIKGFEKNQYVNSEECIVALLVMGLVSWINQSAVFKNERDENGKITRRIWDELIRHDSFMQMKLDPNVFPSEIDAFYLAKNAFDVSAYWYNWESF